jgi:hypothetical protein
MDRGAATPEERGQILNMERTVILYELMMGGVLEGLRRQSAGAVPEEDQLRLIARQAAGHLPAYTPEQIADALLAADRRQGLRRIRSNGHDHWEWVDYL